MNNNLSVNKLKELVIISKDLNEPVNYFFDMLDNRMLENSSIVSKSNAEVIAILNSVQPMINKSLNVDTNITEMMLQQVVDDPIIHGIVLLSNGLNPLNILYITDIKIAVVCLFHKGNMEFWRIALSDIPIVKH